MVSLSNGKDLPLQCMSLYLIQDEDRPMHVLAESWSQALKMWKTHIASENGISVDRALTEVEEPKGICLVCENDDLLLP